MRRFPAQPDLSGWHDIGWMITEPNIALPDLPGRLKAWGHQRVKFTITSR
ncbi:hypothetical protein [Mycobacteroides abscessus]|nr:hypothetical protein [Mycobacteroides abscessus]